MRDFKAEIDRCNTPSDLLQILDDLSAEVERATDSPYEDDLMLSSAHDLELLLRYGEDKLENLLS